MILEVYLFISKKSGERQRESTSGRGGSRGRKTSRLPARRQVQGSIPGPWDYDPSQRQPLKTLSCQGAPNEYLETKFLQNFQKMGQIILTKVLNGNLQYIK